MNIASKYNPAPEAARNINSEIRVAGATGAFFQEIADIISEKMIDDGEVIITRKELPDNYFRALLEYEREGFVQNFGSYLVVTPEGVRDFSFLRGAALSLTKLFLSGRFSGKVLRQKRQGLIRPPPALFGLGAEIAQGVLADHVLTKVVNTIVEEEEIEDLEAMAVEIADYLYNFDQEDMGNI